MTSELDFIAALDAEPGNHWLRQVYADFLEDQGDERAAGMRALAVLKRVPENGVVFCKDSEGFCWWRADKRGFPNTDCWELPRVWYDAINDADAVYRAGLDDSKDFFLLSSAYSAAALAWLRLTDAERAKIMAGVNV